MGIWNSFFGNNAGLSNTTEENNTFLGALSDGAAGITNATAIGFRAKVTQSNSLVLGSINGLNFATADTKVGIGTTAPAANLHVTGTQPPQPLEGAGISAPDVLRVVGAKGGNSFAESGGTGGNVLIQAGDGGDSIITFNGGLGGSITIQPGQRGNGSGGSIGISGNVLLAPANGLVGIGTPSPQSTLHVFKSAAAADTVGGNLIVNRFYDGSWRGASLFSYFPTAHGHDVLAFGVSESATAPNTIGAVKMVVSATGNVGIGTTAPDNTLTVNGTADKPGGGSWGTFSDERLKNIKGRFTSGLKAVMQLQSLRYEYKPNNPLSIKSDGEHVGFSAQAVQKIIPEAVTTNDKGYLLVNNDPIMWTMLNAIKEQQAQIEQQKQEIDALKKLVCSMNASADICKAKDQ
jgi:hypothetical protein